MEERETTTAACEPPPRPPTGPALTGLHVHWERKERESTGNERGREMGKLFPSGRESERPTAFGGGVNEQD